MTPEPRSCEGTDLVALADHVMDRFAARMAGLADGEWRWMPTADVRVGLRWRLAHLADTLDEPRAFTWLGRPAPDHEVDEGDTADAAVARVAAAYARWRSALIAVDDLAAPIGAAAGRYGDATRRSFVLHIVDELVHHTAEAALLRDLHAARN